jgi:hypothetical protein
MNMKNFTFLFLLVCMLLSGTKFSAIAQEKVLINNTITWEWPLPQNYGGNGYYWWHRPGSGLNNLGEMPANDWLTPANYWNGNVYIRAEVVSQPTNTPFVLQMGIWQNGGTSEIICTEHIAVSGGAGSYVEKNLGTFSSWYPQYPGMDFTSPETFDRIGLALWTSNYGQRGCIPMGQGWTNPAECGDAATLQASFFPMQVKIIVVACAQGTSFSGWSNYTGGGASRQPTPAYTIDYANERTSQPVPSTDEYSYSSNMASAVSGSGSNLSLTPGQNVYFRTKAAGEFLESLIQTLTVKARPAAPAFAYDATNQRTLTVLSNEYEYSDNADMSGAVSGAGNYVSFITGTTKYFRKKATGSDFKSGIQSLTGVAKAPTPDYTVDYAAERTTQPIPSTDEYSYNSNMSSAVSGNGTALNLTPGQNVYFRTKASGEIQASDIQTLVVKARPSSPTFTYDAANQRTNQTVSSDYEYSSNADMSGAVSGTGTYVSFSTGTTRYFRKKATASDFRSNVQTLTGTSGGSGGPSNIGPEFVIINQVIDFPNNTDNNGFYFFSYNPSMPSNWVSNYNYVTGQVYTRYEIISQATNTPSGLQFGIWQKIPEGTGTLYENMETIRVLNGPGSVVTNNSSPSTWWTYNGGVDFTQMNIVWHFGINPYKVDPSNVQIRSENAAVWNERFTYWFPMKVRVTVVAVANGYTFSGWQNYIGNGTSPNYSIDYTGEQTSANVVTTDEYSTNQTTWTSGSEAKVVLQPGQDVYFRRKIAPSYSQHLVVPARPAAPSFGIDYINERTGTAVGSAYEYSSNSNMTGAVTGSDQYVSLTPSSTVYFRALATASAFSSNIQTLSIPARPAGPQFTINYIDEKTAEAVASNVEYATVSNFSTLNSGTGTTISLTPGSTMYFRQLATTGQFESAVSSLAVPERLAAPSFGINFATEKTSSAVSTDHEYSLNADMSSAISGSNSIINLTPGTDLYLRKKATSSSFLSGIQHLVVPSRPVAPAVAINYAEEKTAEAISSNIHYSETAAFTSTHEGTGIAISLTPGEDIYFKYKASDAAFASGIQSLDVPARPVVTSQLVSPTIQSPITVDIQFPGNVTGFENADLQVTNGTVGSISGSYTATINPTANGSVGVKVLANSVSPTNFASQLFTINYQGSTAVEKYENQSLKLYPTLASGKITIEGNNILKKEYRVIDLKGQTVLSGTIESAKLDIEVNCLTPGNYYFVIDVDNSPKSLGFVKIKE